MKVIAKIDCPGVFNKGNEYEVAGIVLQGIQGEYCRKFIRGLRKIYSANW